MGVGSGHLAAVVETIPAMTHDCNVFGKDGDVLAAADASWDNA
jgi:hypothetical protein